MSLSGDRHFDLYVGIDYSGAQTPTSSIPGLRVYEADRNSPAFEVPPPPSPRKYWTRKEIAAWLVERLSGDAVVLVGIDHGFSFPMKYLQKYAIPPEWQAFLDDFESHWPTNRDHVYVDFIRDGIEGNALAREGKPQWRRLTEVRARGAKSVFHFDVPGSVAKSTHAGLPWLRFIRRSVGDRVHFWPFDGWEVPLGRSVVAEVYPSIWSREFRMDDRTPDQHDAYSVAEWFRRADGDGTLLRLFQPSLTPEERKVADAEGWILGVK